MSIRSDILQFCREPNRCTLYLVLATSLLHLLVMGRFDLSVDEAHYALYGLHLDWSYFDHPPMVGWMQALALLFSDHAWVLRLWAVLLAAGASWLLYRLSAELYPDASPWLPVVAVALWQSAVIFQVLSMGLVPELPLLFFGLAAALAMHRVVERGGLREWLWLGLWLGLAGLSKYTAVLLVLSLLLLIAWRGRWRMLATPGPWLAALLALLLITPVLGWNYFHDWISFSYQLGHGAPDRHWQGGRLLTAEAAQFLAYGPLLIISAVAGLLAALRRREAGDRLLLAMALPPLLLFAWMGGYETTLPHWTLLAWACAAPLGARWLLTARERRWWPRLLERVGVVYALVLTLLIHAQFTQPWIPFEEGKHPLTDLYGWHEAAERGAELAREEGLPLAVGNWFLASRIAWYARPTPVQVLDARYDQFDLWFNPEGDRFVRGDAALLIVPHIYFDRSAAGLGRFSRCAERGEYTYRLKGRVVNRYRYYSCGGYLG